MATLTKGKTFTNGETVTPQKLHELVDLGGVAGIVNSDIADGAAIADSKLATITTAGKVANSATTATNANTINAIVARDGSGNFSAGTISAALAGNAATATTAASCTGNAATATTAASCTGNAATATKLAAARTINGVAFDGSSNITIATGVSGTIPVSQGGTGATTASGALTNLGAAPASHGHDYAATSHAHDDRYYTETEIDTKLNGLPVSGHTHFNEVLQPSSIYSSASVSGGSVFELSSGTANGSAYSNINFHRGAAVTSATPYATFYQMGAIRGTISPSGASGVAYNTSSDYRLKTNIEPLTDAVARLLQIPAHRFNWLADPTAPKVDGFLAHEAQAIVPESVTGHKDEVDAEGKPIHQGIDQSKLVPLLVAAVQELAARVAALEAR